MSRLNQTKARNQLNRDRTPTHCIACSRAHEEHTTGELIACMGARIRAISQSLKGAP